MEEIGLQLKCPQDDVILAIRRYLSMAGRRLIEECPLRKGLPLLRAKPVPLDAYRTSRVRARAEDEVRPGLSGLLDAYFSYFFSYQPRRALIVGPTVGHWTAVLWDEKALDCSLTRFLSAELGCRAVGYCFIEGEEYSYIELAAGEDVELYSSFLAEDDGRNYLSSRNGQVPEEGPWVTAGYLKKKYQFIHGFYDLPFLRGEKKSFACYQYGGFPDQYNEKNNFPLDVFRYYYFHTAVGDFQAASS